MQLKEVEPDLLAILGLLIVGLACNKHTSYMCHFFCFILITRQQHPVSQKYIDRKLQLGQYQDATLRSVTASLVLPHAHQAKTDQVAFQA